MKNIAIFLDRDGVLTRQSFNKATGEYEAPKTARDVRLLSHTIPSLKRLSKAGYLLFLVSNQPDYAKGKATLRELRKVHKIFDGMLTSNGIRFCEYYYCYHHPNGIVARYSYSCKCRKPSPYFLLKAKKSYGLDLKRSWMIGDRDTDMQCGIAAGTKTILVKGGAPIAKRCKSNSDYKVNGLKEAAYIITSQKNNR